ncbi:hypothetical protein MMC10_008531 [Thelotrema lepadinum]|nr:hypothetical protein [Thelotrema lepadinum]
MDDGYRGAPQPKKKAKSGSVRAARERLEAGIQDTPQQSSVAQWPLFSRGDKSDRVAPSGLPAQNTLNKGPPPQRPPRPSYVPSILDSTKRGDQMTEIPYEQAQDSTGGAIQQQTRYWEPNYALSSPPPPSTPGTGISSSSSRDSNGSSVGSIPDFPVPSLPTNPPPPPQFRRNANLGPPPSSRRGASSYYSQSSFVAPIPEEAWEPSSPPRRVLPNKPNDAEDWNDEESDYYGTRGPEDDEHYDRDSRSPDADSSTGLVRQASLGKQYKPSLTTVRSFKDMPSTKPNGSRNLTGQSMTESILMMLDDTDNSTFYRGPSEESQGSDEGQFSEKPRSKSPRSPPVDPQVELILGGLEKGGALKSGTMAPMITSVDERSPSPAFHPAPPIGFDDSRPGEVRGSLTSLSDLIRRATKVAANLEKGRTASRLGLLDMFNSSNPNLLKGGNEQPRRTSVSDMLASFPAPALGTPTARSPRPESGSKWPSPVANSNLHLAQTPDADTQKGDRRRRCCGMPVWLFVFLLLVLFLLIAAAVVIPIVLIVLPKQNQPAAPPAPLSNCPSTNPCSNGGQSLVSANSCRCVCMNGFTGTNCTMPADSSCTSTTVDSFNNATLGSSIPRLFSGASSNFSIPLNTTALLSDFSSAQLTCTDENTLVTFTKPQQRRDLPHPVQEYVAPLPVVTLAPRIADPEPQSPSAVTVDGIVFNGPPTSTAPDLETTAGPTPTPTSTSLPNGPSSQQIDFAGVAILYIFQQTQLSTAVDAQKSLENAFSNGTFSGPVLVTSNITVDVNLMKVTVGGTTVGKS